MSPGFWAWYDANISARWWASASMWIGIGAGLVEVLPEYLQKSLDNIEMISSMLDWTDSKKRNIQAFLLFVALPIARAWKQKKSEQAQIAQATRNELVVPTLKSGVTVRGELM